MEFLNSYFHPKHLGVCQWRLKREISFLSPVGIFISLKGKWRSYGRWRSNDILCWNRPFSSTSLVWLTSFGTYGRWESSRYFPLYVRGIAPFMSSYGHPCSIRASAGCSIIQVEWSSFFLKRYVDFPFLNYLFPFLTVMHPFCPWKWWCTLKQQEAELLWKLPKY